MVGIKGTGMAALAEILKAGGAILTGSDTHEKFYTDQILARLKIPVTENFSPQNISDDVDLVVYSSAYSKDNNPELHSALKRSLPLCTYFEALGELSKNRNSSGISGVHGKTTTTALVGTIVKELHMPATIIAGSQVPTFNDSSTLILGDKYLIAETCEYKKQFLNFKANQIIMTSVELDHPDYFHNLKEISAAFEDYAFSLPHNGIFIFNIDNSGTVRISESVRNSRKDIHLVSYGKAGNGRFQITKIVFSAGEISFCLKGFDEVFVLNVPGEHSVSNATAAIALSIILLEMERGNTTKEDIVCIKNALKSFRSSKRRSEILGEAGGVLFIDDYAHHPTAISATLKGYRKFFPGRKIIVDFMPHTYSRTKELLPGFGTSFSCADEVILHKIYASARENNNHSVTGQDLFNEVEKNHSHVHYFHNVMDAASYLKDILHPGVLFVTMGAGDNWKIGQYLYNYFQGSI